MPVGYLNTHRERRDLLTDILVCACCYEEKIIPLPSESKYILGGIANGTIDYPSDMSFNEESLKNPSVYRGQDSWNFKADLWKTFEKFVSGSKDKLTLFVKESLLSLFKPEVKYYDLYKPYFETELEVNLSGFRLSILPVTLGLKTSLLYGPVVLSKKRLDGGYYLSSEKS